MPFRALFVPVALLLCTVLTPAVDIAAQPRPSSSTAHALFGEIAAADSITFAAFNARDLGTLRTRFTKDLEFYHDQSGLTSYEENIAAFEGLFGRDDGLRRALVPGSLEVYPAGDGRAIEVGEHTFCHMEGGEEDCGTFPFVMVWQHEGGVWKVSRVISYGH